jgi:CRP/FNR family transcriptional regulator
MERSDGAQHPAKEELRALLVRQARYFGLTTGAIVELVRCARIEHPVHTLCVSGDRDDLVNLVIRGIVRIEIVVPSGAMMILKFLGRGEFFCLPPSPRSGAYHLRAVAHEPGTVAVWTRDSLARVVALLPVESIMQLLTTSWLHLARLAEGRCLLRLLRLEERVTLFLRRLARRHGTVHPHGTLIDIRLRDAEIAQLVGATRFSVNRCMTRLHRAGALERIGDRIVLLHAPAAGHDAGLEVRA